MDDNKLNGSWEEIGGHLFYVIRGQGRYIRVRVPRITAPYAPVNIGY